MSIFQNNLLAAAASTVSGGDTYELYTWGSNNYGQMGDGTQTNKSSPVLIGDAFMGELDVEEDGLYKIQCKVTNTDEQSGVVKADGTLWTWGFGRYGALGHGNTTNYSSPVQVGSDTDWMTISKQRTHAMTAVKTDGTMWGWGNNSGSSHALTKSSPVQVGTDTDWSWLMGAGDNFGFVCKTNGALYLWGGGDANVFAGASKPNIYTPTQVTDKYYDWVGAGSWNSLWGIEKDEGKLWAWGRGEGGKNGQGNILTYASPIQVGTDTNWTHSMGQLKNSVLAAKSNGELYGWGINDDGVLGLGNKTKYSSPVQLADKAWAIAGHGMCEQCAHAVTDENGDNTGGELWAVGGAMGDAQSGTGSTENISSPVQVGTDTDWLVVNVGGPTKSNTKLAIKKSS